MITFHDVNRVTGRVLPIILDALTAAGATFEVLPRPQDALGTMPIALGTPPDLNRPGVSGYTLMGAVNVVARVRAEPTTESAILFGGVPVGTALTVTGRTDGWYQVLHEGQAGWMAGRAIDFKQRFATQFASLLIFARIGGAPLLGVARLGNDEFDHAGNRRIGQRRGGQIVNSGMDQVFPADLRHAHLPRRHPCQLHPPAVDRRQRRGGHGDGGARAHEGVVGIQQL